MMGFNIFIFLLIGEFLLNYSQEATIGLALSELSDDLNFTPLFTRYLISFLLLLGSIFGIIIGLLTDLFLNKIFVVVFSHILCCFTMTLSFLIAIMGQSYLVMVLMNVLICSVFFYAMVGGVRYIFLAEQIPANQVWEIRKCLLLIIFVKFLGSFAFGLLSLVPLENSFYLCSSFVMVVLNILYTFFLIILTPLLQSINTRKSIISVISEDKIIEEDFFDLMAHFFKKRRWLKVVIILSLYTSYGFITFMLPDILQKQFDNIAFESNKKPVPYKVMRSYLTLILLIFIELIIRPYMKNRGFHHIDLQYICASMIVISVPMGMASMAQNLCDSNNNLLPGNDAALLMVYNGLNYNLTVQSKLFEKKDIFRRMNYAFLIESNVMSADVNYTYNKKTYDYTFDISVGQSVSYVIKKNEILRLKGYDPLYYGPPGFNKRGYPIIFIVPIDSEIMGEIAFSNKKTPFDSTHFRTKVFEDERIFISLPPDTYNIKFKGNGKLYTKDKPVTFKYGGIYSIIMHQLTDINNTFINIHEFVQPCGFEFYTILIYIFSMAHSLAEALGLVSLYAFSYFEMPLKFRYMFFSFVYLAQTTGHGAHLWISFKWYMQYTFFKLVAFFTSHLLCTMLFILLSTLYKSKYYY